MKPSHLMFTSILCGCLNAAHAGDDAIRCTVTDPSKQPLNVRDSPNGSKLGTLRNGTMVDMLSIEKDTQKRAWALIMWDGQPLKHATPEAAHEGWVFRQYLKCQNRAKAR